MISRLPSRYVGILTPLILSIFMSGIVSGIATAKSIGLAPGLVAAWLSAWGSSWIVAFPILLVLQPAVHRLVGALVHKRKFLGQRMRNRNARAGLRQ